MSKTARVTFLAVCAVWAMSGEAEARERAPRQSVLEQVRNGAFAENCASVSASAANAGDGGATAPGIIDTQRTAPAATRQGIRVLPEARATATLRSILQRFQAVQPPPTGVTPVVWIQDSHEVDARQRGAGDIYITRGALDALIADGRGATDPQVTADVSFILAHEYAHVLMCHYNRVVRTNQTTQAIDALASLGTASMYLRELRTQQTAGGGTGFTLANEGRFREGVAETMAARSVMQQLNSGLVNPAWGREQERDADHLAVELMAAAGMPADFVPELLFNLNTAEATFMSDANAVLGRMSQRLVADLSAPNAGQPLNIADRLRGAAQRGGRELLTGFLQRNLGHFHDDPEDRAERVALMVQFLGAIDTSAFPAWAAPVAHGFRQAAAVEFAGSRYAHEANTLLAQNNIEGGCAAAQRATAAAANNPLVVLAGANCAIARNESARAAQHFNRLTQSPYAVPDDFVAGSQIWAAANNRANATRMLDTGATRFGHDSFYVPRMLVLSSFSDVQGVAATRDQCVNSSQNTRLRGECQQVAAQLTGQPAQTPAQQPSPVNTLEQVLRNPFGNRN
jgi:Peptidase family M48